MTPEAIEGWRNRSRGDLLAFTRWMFKARKGSKWELGAHHHLLNAALMRVYSGAIKRLIINIPPRYSKTELVANFIAWSLGQYPDSEFIYSSYSGRLAAKTSWDCRETVSHPEYQKIFPGTKLRDDSSARDEWRTTAGGIVYAVGSGGTITGYGAGKMRSGFGGAIIIDDPHKADEASSEIMRENVWDWFQNTVESRTNSKDTPIIVVMQRLHMEDLAGHLIRGDNGEEWTVLCLPAIKADGTALWPFKHSIEKLERMRDAAPYHFSGQYLQQPIPDGGGLFNASKIQIEEVTPAGLTACRGWDAAASQGKGDWTVGALVGRDRDGTYWILDIVRQRTGEPRRLAKQVAQMDGTEVAISWPQDPGQAGKDQAQSMVRDFAGWNFTTSPETGAKRTRWEPFAAQVNGGNVKMVRASWNRALIEEMETDGQVHDDQLDALARAFTKVAAVADPLLNAMYDGMERQKRTEHGIKGDSSFSVEITPEIMEEVEEGW